MFINTLSRRYFCTSGCPNELCTDSYRPPLLHLCTSFSSGQVNWLNIKCSICHLLTTEPEDDGRDSGKRTTTALKYLWFSGSGFPSLWRQSAQLRTKRQTMAKLPVFNSYVIKDNHSATVTHTCWATAVAFCSACVSRRWSRFVFSWFSAACLSYCKLVTRNQRFNSTSVLYIPCCSLVRRLAITSERQHCQRCSLTVKERRQQSLLLRLLFRQVITTSHSWMVEWTTPNL